MQDKLISANFSLNGFKFQQTSPKVIENDFPTFSLHDFALSSMG
jgi:hypothetical protein